MLCGSLQRLAISCVCAVYGCQLKQLTGLSLQCFLAHDERVMCRLPMIHQNSMRFYNDIAYDGVYNGLVLDEDEGESALQSALNLSKLRLHLLHTALAIACHKTSMLRPQTSIHHVFAPCLSVWECILLAW